MKKFIRLLVLMLAPAAHAQSTDVLIEVTRDRTSGIFSKSPVVQRAVLVKPTQATDTVLMYFRGIPGYALIESAADRRRNTPRWLGINMPLILQSGIAFVVMDCPTDQWGSRTDYAATNCMDDYRSSQQHADDVRSIMAKLRDEHGFSRFYLLGHSAGAVSSRWLAKHLGNEIAGSIHSAGVNVPNVRGYGRSMGGFPYGEIKAPMLHVHHENDGCRGTPYDIVKSYARDNLVTVRGGIAEGDPCGGGHLHSYQGREEVVVKAVIHWIKTGKVESVVGE